jgi:hypothetical protein
MWLALMRGSGLRSMVWLRRRELEGKQQKKPKTTTKQRIGSSYHADDDGYLNPTNTR